MTERLHFTSLSAIRVVSSAYLRLLIFLPAILIPVCVSSSPAIADPKEKEIYELSDEEYRIILLKKLKKYENTNN